jgi:chemotaxis protein methyltransferase CheR
VEMSLPTFVQFRDLIYEKSGIYFPDNKKYVLDSRLMPRLAEQNCTTFEEYLALLKTDGWRDKEFPALFNVVTTNETFFFRDVFQLQAFTSLILPAALKHNQATKRLRIWSAACSTGDEPYTLAILLLEHREGARPLERRSAETSRLGTRAPGPRDEGSVLAGPGWEGGAAGCDWALKDWNIEIMASDISEAAVAAARCGEYGTYALRNVSPALRARYFTAMDRELYAVKPEVKHFVRCANINLLEGARLKLIKGLDVIFCRNCLIYFDDKAKKRVIDNFYDCLNPHGYLVIGFSESLHNVTRAFRPIPCHKAVIYQKI